MRATFFAGVALSNFFCRVDDRVTAEQPAAKLLLLTVMEEGRVRIQLAAVLKILIYLTFLF